MIDSFLYLFTGIIGIVTIALMITSYKSNPFYNVFLLLIIVLISIRFLIHGSYELGLQSIFTPDKGAYSLLYLIIVPCFYLYHKNLVLQKKAYDPKDLKHFIYIGFLYTINTIPFFKESYIFYFGSITNLFFLSVFIFFYLISIFNLLSKKIWFKKDLPISNIHFNLIKNWITYLFTLNTLGAIGLLASIYIEITIGSSLSGKSLASFLLVFWLFIYFKILTSPEILYGLPILNEKLLKFNAPIIENKQPANIINNHWILETEAQKNNQDLKLQGKIKSNIISYTQEIDRLKAEEFIFRDQKASQTEIAKALGVPTSHIVYLFKYHSNISFSEYRMQSRIQDAITLIETGFLKAKTMESLAYTTGFASYNPFFSAFKKITTYAPQDYLKTTKNVIEE